MVCKIKIVSIQKNICISLVDILLLKIYNYKIVFQQ